MVRRTWTRTSNSGRVRLYGAVASVATIVTLAVGIGAWHFVAGAQPRLTGTVLDARPAPDFRLQDASGRTYSLEQLRGKAVVLTFLYTNCTDTCPLTAEMLRHADEAAGHPSNVVFVAISVDPTGDTPANIAAFDAKHHLDELGNRWLYLIGSQQDLDSVWHAYGIYAPTQPVDPGAPDHTTGIYLLDKQGRERVFTDVDIRAEDLARDVLILAGS
jgi:protein SCO1/2